MDSTFEIYEIAATDETPHIHFDKRKGEILIKGVSIPENTVEFYWKFNREFSEYTTNPAPRTVATIALRYMNSSTSQVITNMLRTFDQMIALKTKIEINWVYEKEDLEMKELGEFYQKIMKGKINLHAVDSL